MKRTNVSHLKAHLSSYLADVRNGETVIVHDRRTPIARLVPFTPDADDFEVREPCSDLGEVKGVRLLRPVDVVQVLRESRGQR